MEFIGPLSSSDLEKAAARFYPEGIEGYVDVALLLQELNQVAKQIAGARVQESFHTQERSLYEPMKALLERHLPSNGLVHVENLLYKTAEPGKKTDLSIGCVWHKGKDRLFADLHCTHFIELKSMFAGETLARAKAPRMRAGLYRQLFLRSRGTRDPDSKIKVRLGTGAAARQEQVFRNRVACRRCGAFAAGRCVPCGEPLRLCVRGLCFRN